MPGKERAKYTARTDNRIRRIVAAMDDICTEPGTTKGDKWEALVELRDAINERAVRFALATSKYGGHGVTCPKAPHVEGHGYLHEESDDRPYDVDGVNYCGRCHQAL